MAENKDACCDNDERRPFNGEFLNALLFSELGCTAFFISPNLALTAAHCVFNNTTDRFLAVSDEFSQSRIMLWRLAVGGTWPYAMPGCFQVHVPGGFRDATRTEDAPEHDYAVIDFSTSDGPCSNPAPAPMWPRLVCSRDSCGQQPGELERSALGLDCSQQGNVKGGVLVGGISMQPATWLWLPLVLLAGAACSEGGPSDDSGGGPNTAQEGCIEQASPMADDAKTAEGIAIKDVLEVVRREHAAALTWPDGESTQIRFVASEAQALFVTSRDDPKYEAHRAVRCDDRVVVKTRARVTTDDGKFGVGIPELRLEIVKSNWIVGSSHGLPKSMLRGSYANTTAPAGKCLRGTSVGVSLSLSEPRFRGELANTISDVPCGQSDPNEGLTPSKGASW